VARKAGLKKRPVEYYRMLYGDTALNGSIAATRCGHAFFTTDIVFSPLTRLRRREGPDADRETINAVNGSKSRKPKRTASSPATRARC